MKISTKGRYALTIMINIGREYKNDRYISLTEISEREGISLKYLEKIMINLKNSDFVIAAKGKDGGYKLKKSPDLYSIGEIIRAADEDLNVVSCINNKCPKEKKCDTYSLWKGLNDEINEYLDSKKLGDYL